MSRAALLQLLAILGVVGVLAQLVSDAVMGALPRTDPSVDCQLACSRNPDCARAWMYDGECLLLYIESAERSEPPAAPRKLAQPAPEGTDAL